MRKLSKSDLLMSIVVYILLFLAAAACLVPFLNVLSKAISANWAVTSGRVGLWPVGLDFSNVWYILGDHTFLNALKISVIVTVVGTLSSVFFTGIAAYPLSKKHLPGVKFILILYVFTMLFNGGLIPSYLLIKYLGLMNNLGSLILPSLINVFDLLLIKNFYENLPESLEESAKLDGANNLTIVLRIIIPISAPVFATISLFYAVGYWGDWFHPMLYISNPALQPLALFLRNLVLESDTSSLIMNLLNVQDLMNISTQGLQNAAIIVSTLPILLVYPFLQRYFVKGIILGSVKG